MTTNRQQITDNRQQTFTPTLTLPPRGGGLGGWGRVLFASGLKRKLTTVLCVLSFAFCYQSSSLAQEASWNPEELIKTYMIDNYPWGIVEVNNVKTSGDIPAKVPERITVIKGPLGNAVFSFEGKNGKRITVNANVTARDPVVKSKRTFKKGHILQNDDIYTSSVDVTRMPGSAVRSVEEIIGKPLKRSIIADIPIVEDMVEKAITVKTGKMVTLLIETPEFSITAPGKLKETGYVGVLVRAANLSSKKEVSGVLIDENTVKAEF